LISPIKIRSKSLQLMTQMTKRTRKRKTRMTRNLKRRTRIRMPKARMKLRKQRRPQQIFLMPRTNYPGTLEESVSKLTN
jgi:hypothetical protein